MAIFNSYVKLPEGMVYGYVSFIPSKNGIHPDVPTWKNESANVAGASGACASPRGVSWSKLLMDAMGCQRFSKGKLEDFPREASAND
jgi:hypothetical protein